MAKLVEIRGRVLGGDKPPLICTPLTGESEAAILSELNKILPKEPDLIEWRVDFFQGIGNLQEVISLVEKIREISGNTPILFTVRSQREGGQPIPLSDQEVVELYVAICQSRSIDIIDFELSNREEHLRVVREASRANGIKMIMSFHNFKLTPSPEVIQGKFAEAERVGADIAKVAVMPRNPEDVLSLLSLTLEAKNKLNMPVITMSMGGYGSLTRMFGWVFGSAVTFAVGENSSAPGQLPIEDLKTVLGIVQKSMI